MWLRDRLEDFVYEAEAADRRLNGNEWTRRMVEEMLGDLSPHISGMPSNEDDRRYKSVRLLRLPELQYDHGMPVGDVRCTRALFVGENGKLYVEGPRRRMGKTIIDIHPLTLKDARGWEGVSANNVLESLLPFFI